MHVDTELARQRSSSPRISGEASVAYEPQCPDQLVKALNTGVQSRKMVFPEHGGYRICETWQPPQQLDAETRSALKFYLARLEAYLAPAARPLLLSRILALLSHYRLEAHSPQVEACIADDWADDLGSYPLWAINHAARSWRRAKRFKPQISEMIEICEEAVKDLNGVYGRLQSMACLCESMDFDETA